MKRGHRCVFPVARSVCCLARSPQSSVDGRTSVFLASGMVYGPPPRHRPSAPAPDRAATPFYVPPSRKHAREATATHIEVESGVSDLACDREPGDRRLVWDGIRFALRPGPGCTRSGPASSGLAAASRRGCGGAESHRFGKPDQAGRGALTSDGRPVSLQCGLGQPPGDHLHAGPLAQTGLAALAGQSVEG